VATVRRSESSSPLGALYQVDAGLLDVGFVDAGAADGPVVLLLHGWPYDIHSFGDVVPRLVDRGYRVIIPSLRGFGTTRFRSDDTVRNGQQSVVALDALNLMDALGIESAIVGGFDWGARTALILAALWPERCAGVVAVSGYIIVNLAANRNPLPPAAELGWWYQYYFATERGRRGYATNRNEFNRLIWHLASPRWNFTDEVFDATAASFDNPDHVEIVVHNYRWRLGLADGERQYDALEERLAERPLITVPAVTLSSDFDGAAADGAAYSDRFTGSHSHRVLRGIGHNVPQEAPNAFADAVLDVVPI
jgi:pimeloyl-ACP methyl ester carboxylesterase